MMKKHTRQRVLTAGFSIILMASTVAHAAAIGTYVLTPIESVNGDTQAFDLNNQGQVVGQSFSADGSYHGFVWSSETGMIDLGSLGGYANSAAIRINDLGDVLGYQRTSDGAEQGFVWSQQSGFTNIDGSLATAPAGINNMGQVVGTASSDGFLQSNFGFIYLNGSGVNPVSILGSASQEVRAINDKGQMVVAASDPSGALFLCSPGRDPVEISGAGFTTATAQIINNQGVVAGNMTSIDGRVHAVTWSAEAGLVDLTPNVERGASAEGINDEGAVVGFDISSDHTIHGFLNDNGVMYDLASLIDASGTGWSSLVPTAINDNGQIVGFGTFDGQQQAFILNPSTSPTTSLAPEPATLSLLALATPRLLKRRR